MTGHVADRGLWIRRFHPAPAGSVRVLCFPHAGGSASFFHPVSRALSPVAEVLAVQYPGRQDRRKERPLDSIDDLAEGVFAALEPSTDRPMIFFGHSMGAVLAFEVARRLEQRGRGVPLHLFASGRRAPSRHRDESIHLRSDDEIVAELKKLSGTDQAILGDEEILRMVLPALRSDYRAIETYRHPEGVRLSCPITVMVGDNDPRVSIDEARDWSEHTTADCDLQVFAGGHFFLAHHQTEINKMISGQVATLARRAEGR